MRFASRTARRAAIAAVASGALAAGAFALMSPASASPHANTDTHGTMGVHVANQRTTYSFRTVDNPADLTFNQLLGINSQGVIAGYFGSGAQGHPNKGYLLPRPYAQYINENFPARPGRAASAMVSGCQADAPPSRWTAAARRTRIR